MTGVGFTFKAVARGVALLCWLPCTGSSPPSLLTLPHPFPPPPSIAKGLRLLKSSHTSNSIKTVPVPLLSVTYKGGPSSSSSSNLCFFCGCGFDAVMLNDFITIKKWARKTGILTGPLSSIPGYCAALAFKTLPKGVRRIHELKVRVTAPISQDTTWIDHRRGDFATNVGGGVVFEGTTGILAAATVPFYGGGMKLFPFARMGREGMHLRLGRMSPVVGAINIPGVFKGWYRDKKTQRIVDFRGEEFDVEFLGEGGPKPVQHSGEGVGGKTGFNVKTVGDVEFWDWEEDRVVIDE